MKVMIIGQDPLEVTTEQGHKLIQSIVSGAEYVIVDGEYVKASSITGVRKDKEDIPKQYWGSLPAGKIENILRGGEPASTNSEGYKKFQSIRRKLANRM